jgi:tetratricopeptide (TPR) repeat protein
MGDVEERSYIVQEHTSGGSLAEFLRGRAQSASPSARLVLQITSALQHVHEKGIVHCQLNPDCILLEPHAGSHESSELDHFQPKLTDFGNLTVFESVEHLNSPGESIEGVYYLAPEQFAVVGQCSRDGRLDIYALGCILYELLTGRPPFRSISLDDTIKLIKHEQPIPPSKLEPTVPRTLENICLKCIEKDPNRRYSTAQALANDLVGFLHDQPVQAKPISRLVRVRQWSKRNPGKAIALLLLLASAVLGPLLAVREYQLRQENMAQSMRDQTEYKHAKEDLNRAGKAIEQIHSRLAYSWRFEDPAFMELQKGIMTVTLPYFEHLAKHSYSNDSLKIRQARCLQILGDWQAQNKEVDKAQVSFMQSIKLAKDLKPSDTISEIELSTALASIHRELGRFQQNNLSHYPQAEENYRTSLEHIDKLAKLEGAETVYDLSAKVYGLLANAIGSQEDPRRRSRRDEQFGNLSQSIAFHEKMMALHPDREELIYGTIYSHKSVYYFFRMLKDYENQITALRQALELAKKANQSRFASIESTLFVSSMYHELGHALIAANQREAGLAEFKLGKKMLENLLVAFPSDKRIEGRIKNFERMLNDKSKPQPPQ